MRLEDLDYDLPADRIAQVPTARREDARLLIVDRAAGELRDEHVSDLPAWLRAGDVLALNETRVMPARLLLRRPSGRALELLFVRPEPGADGRTWRTLARPARAVSVGSRWEHPGTGLVLHCVGAEHAGERLLRIEAGDLATTLHAAGRVPLPPYIRRAPDARDAERYQTVFARVEGAVAAPTAALHFSHELLGRLAAAGVATAPLVLHVGPGTFRPVVAADPAHHRMDAEWFELGEESAARLRAARAAGGRIIAIGTTSVRALESACDAHDGRLAASRGWTEKFILPPHDFRGIDGLLTNFHLPRTSLLLLVAAWTGPELMREAYAHAIREGYRFYSYGDAMLVL